MTTMQAVIAGLAVAVIVGIGFLLRQRQQLPPTLLDRETLSVTDVYRQFYSDLGVSLEQFSIWWDEIGRAFEVPSGRIRPGDRFGVELPLRTFFGTSDEDTFLFRTLSRVVGREVAVDALPKLQTVDEFIRFLSARACVPPKT